MTGEPTHTASKERMVPEQMFCLNSVCPKNQILLSKSHAVAIALRFQLCLARYKVLQMKNSRRSALQSSHHENTMIRAPQLLITASKCSCHYVLLSAIFSPLHSITNEEQCYNRLCTEKTDDSHLQTYGREAMHRATANRHLEVSAKRNGTQRRTKVSP